MASAPRGLRDVVEHRASERGAIEGEDEGRRFVAMHSLLLYLQLCLTYHDRLRYESLSLFLSALGRPFSVTSHATHMRHVRLWRRGAGGP